MKKFLFIFFSLVPYILYCQDFSTEFIFRNAIGKTDTITVGYSTDASDSLDVSLGEINIPDGHIDTNFCVYASNVIAYEDGKFLKPDYRTKKQLLNAKLNALPICIDVICKDFPLTIKWDKLQFQDTSRSQSFIIPGPPGGWFDVGVGPLFLRTTDSIVYSQEDMENWANHYIDSIHAKQVKVWKLYIGFANEKNNVSFSVQKDEQVSVFPNPCKNSLNVLFASKKNVLLQLCEPTGKPLFTKQFNGFSTIIDMSYLHRGIYFLKITDNKTNTMYKIIKN